MRMPPRIRDTEASWQGKHGGGKTQVQHTSNQLRWDVNLTPGEEHLQPHGITFTRGEMVPV